MALKTLASQASRRAAHRHALAFSILYWAAAFWIGPRGNFPINDDWAYAWAVERLLGEGSLRLSQWTTATALGQVLWGALFCLPTGFSHGALRFSTLVLAWGGLLAFHRTLLRLGAPGASAFAGLLSLWLCPLFFNLSFSFMTDVQALSWMLLGSYALTRGLQGDERWLWGAGAFFAWAYLIRQTGACLAAGAALAVAAASGERRLWRCAALLAPTALAVGGHTAWSAAVGSTFAAGVYNVPATVAHLARPFEAGLDALARLTGASLYLGLFLAPWTLGTQARRPTSPESRASRVVLALLTGAWGLLLALGGAPASGNIVGRFGLGVCSLGDSCAFKAAGVFGAPWFWPIATALGAASSALLAQRCGLWRELARGPWGASACGFAMAFLLSLAGRDYYDRYTLVLFPPLIAACALTFRPRLRLAAPALALAAWSLLGTRDHLSWRAAVWEGAGRLVAMGSDPRDVSGGMEWDAWHSYEERMARLLKERPLDSLGLLDWREERKAAWVSFAPASLDPGLRRVGEVSYWSALSLGDEKVFLWLKDGHYRL